MQHEPRHQRGFARPCRTLPPHIRASIWLSAECRKLRQLSIPSNELPRKDLLYLVQIHRLRQPDSRETPYEDPGVDNASVTTSRRAAAPDNGSPPPRLVTHAEHHPPAARPADRSVQLDAGI